MDAPNPARQMALIGKARFGRDLGKTEFSFAHHFDCALQSQMNDVTMRAHADGAGEGAVRVNVHECAEPHELCTAGDGGG